MNDVFGVLQINQYKFPSAPVCSSAYCIRRPADKRRARSAGWRTGTRSADQLMELWMM